MQIHEANKSSASDETLSPLTSGNYEPLATGRSKRVLFVIGEQGSPLRYRVYLPAESLSLYGVEARVIHYMERRLEAAANDADFVVIYRAPATNRLLETIKQLREKRVPVLFDIDDLIFDTRVAAEVPFLQTHPTHVKQWWLTYMNALCTSMQECDVLVGSTLPLCEHAAQSVGIPTRRFANGISLRMMKLADAALQKPRAGGPVRLGYFSGSPTHNEDWEMIEAAILNVLQRFPEIELWLVGNLTPSNVLKDFGSRVKRLPFRIWYELPGMLRDIDINLAPLVPGSRFNDAKSAIKWLETAVVGTPTIASPTQPFREVISHGVNGCLALAADEWQESLTRLLENSAARRLMGERARVDALSLFSPQAQGRRYVEILEFAGRLVNEGSDWRVRSLIAPVVVEEIRPTPLPDPFHLKLIVDGMEAQKVTAGIRTGRALDFPLRVSGSGAIRLELLLTTYGGTGASLKVTLRDRDNTHAIASSVAPAEAVNNDAWTGFDFDLEACEGQLWARVERVADGAGKKSKLALWARADGQHFVGGRAQVGEPCLRIWGGESLVEVEPTEAPQVGSVAKLRSKLRSADYVRRTKGHTALRDLVKHHH